MSIDKIEIIRALETVVDPQSGMNIIERKMVRDLETDDQNNVRFTLVLPSLQVAYKNELNFASIAAVKQRFPEAEVHVHVVDKQAVGEKDEGPLPQVKNIIAVASGKGGVGKSTISVNLALALKERGYKVGLIDADLYGPSVPTMLGLFGKRPKVKEVHGQPRIIPLLYEGMPVMSIGFIIEPEQAVVLRGPRLASIIQQFIREVLWDSLDYLIIDLPPGTGDIQLTLVQTVPVTGAVIVTTPQEVAVADAVKAANMFRMSNVKVPLLGVVENMSWFTPAELPNNKYYLFGQGGGQQLAEKMETTLLGQVPIVQSIREGGDAGKPVVLGPDSLEREAFFHLAKALEKAVEKRKAEMPPTETVKIIHR